MQGLLSRTLRRPERTLLLLALLPISFVILLVLQYGYTVPWLDEYAHIAQLLRAHFNGTLTLSDLASQRGDHRLLFPFLVSIIFTDLNGGNTAWELGFSILLMLGSLWLVWAIYRMQQRGREHALYFVIPVAFLIFSVSQRDNYIWGSQKCIFMMMTCLYATAWGLARFPGSRRAFAIGVVAALLASWSFLSGNLLWLIIPAALWLNGYRRVSTYALWGLLALVHFALFFNGYVRSEAVSVALSAESLVGSARYFLTYLGSPFSPETHYLLEGFTHSDNLPQTTRYALFMGVFGAGLFLLNAGYALFAARVSLRQLSPWALLIAFSVGNGALLSLGRGNEFFFALAARYITLVVPFWIALAALILINASDYWRKRETPRLTANGLLVANIVALIVFGGGYGANFYRAVEARDSLKQTMEMCYLTRTWGDSRCGISHFFSNNDPDARGFVANLIGFLQARQMYILREPLVTLPLLNVEITVVDGADVRRMGYDVASVGNTPVLFMHAPAVVEQPLSLPNAPAAMTLKTAAFLEPATLISDPSVPQDGAIFRLELLDERREVLRSEEILFDSAVRKTPIPVEWDLSEYRGRDLTLRYTTENRELAGYDWTMWVNPLLEIRRVQ